MPRQDIPASKTDAQLERLLTPEETADRLRVSLSWLAKSRMQGDGPPYMQFGRSIRYGDRTLVQYTKSRVRLSTSERERVLPARRKRARKP